MKPGLYILFFLVSFIFWIFINKLQSQISSTEVKNRKLRTKIGYLEKTLEKISKFNEKYKDLKFTVKKQIKTWKLDAFMYRDAILKLNDPSRDPNFRLVTLIIHWDNNPKRYQDYFNCLQNNLMNPIIEQIIIFTKTSFEFHSLLFQEKIQVELMPTFEPQNMLDYSNHILKGKIIVYSNPDIIYDYTLLNIHHIKSNQVHFLSRQRTNNGFSFKIQPPKDKRFMNQCYFYKGIHDAISFISPLNVRYLEILNDSSLKKINSCYDIILTHLDKNLESKEEFKGSHVKPSPKFIYNINLRAQNKNLTS